MSERPNEQRSLKKSAGRTDRVFKALADRTRRKMLDLLAKRPRTTGQLAAAFGGLSRFAVMKHLRVLQRAGLIIVTREGRKRWNSLNPVPIREVLRRWVDRQQEMWADVMLNVRDAAEASSDAPASASQDVIEKDKSNSKGSES